MKQHLVVRVLPLTLVLGFLASCSQTSGSPGGQVFDYALLVNRLRAAGATVETQGTAGDTYGLHGRGRALLVNAARVEVYEYSDAAGAEADAQHISADGTTFRWQGSFGSEHVVTVDFVAPPHWYRAGRILVLYVGADASIGALLEQQLGQPFAGQEHF